MRKRVLKRRPRQERVLVTADDFHAVLAGLRGLHAAGYQPWVATWHAEGYAARSRAGGGRVVVPNPGVADADFVAAVAETAARIGAVAVIPDSEPALHALAGQDDRFAAGITVGAPSAEVVARATDKAALMRIAPSLGLTVPATSIVTREQLERNDVEVTFPAIVKPVRTRTRGEKGALEHGAAHHVSTPFALREATNELPGDAWLVQEVVHGELGAIGGVAWNGNLVCGVHQVARRIWPYPGGSAYAVTVHPNVRLEQALDRLLGQLGWSGLFQAQFIHAPYGDYLIDFNPRMYGSLALAVGAGANLPAIWLDLLLGRDPVIPRYRVGARFRSEEKDVQILLRELAHGDRSAALAGLLPRRNTAHAILTVRDPLPALVSIAKVRDRGLERLRGILSEASSDERPT
jgi:predicted ATP-grasp superfamily ATP-dependent carboligase